MFIPSCPASVKNRLKQAPRRRISRINRLGTGIENLETRQMMSATAVLDFDGASLSGSEMSAGGWDAFGSTNVTNFRDLFDGSVNYLDLNFDGDINDVDADVAIERILTKVRDDFAPYDLHIRLGDHDTDQRLLVDGDPGDVVVLVTGGRDFRPNMNALGVAPWSDLGNEHDEIVWAFGRSIATASPTADVWINRVARTISQEMGHAFGLGHPIDTPLGLEVRSHHIMNNTTPVDVNHDFAFQDLWYETDVFSFRVQRSEEHPEFNTAIQNSHRYLSHPDVLGRSPEPWVATLRPGQLTVSGSDYANEIEIRPITANSWEVSIETTIASRWESFVISQTKRVDPLVPSIHSLNPFTEPLSRIYVYGKGGNDTIVSAVDVGMLAYGGIGHDVLYGGTGNDWLFGENGDDRLYGRTGRDRLYGGNGNDRLDGGTGDDWLYGGAHHDVLLGRAGADYLFGQNGDDHLDGGHDTARDILFGGLGSDHFVQHHNQRTWWWYIQWSPEDQLNDVDVASGDTVENLYHNPFANRVLAQA